MPMNPSNTSWGIDISKGNALVYIRKDQPPDFDPWLDMYDSLAEETGIPLTVLGEGCLYLDQTNPGAFFNHVKRLKNVGRLWGDVEVPCLLYIRSSKGAERKDWSVFYPEVDSLSDITAIINEGKL